MPSKFFDNGRENEIINNLKNENKSLEFRIGCLLKVLKKLEEENFALNIRNLELEILNGDKFVSDIEKNEEIAEKNKEIARKNKIIAGKDKKIKELRKKITIMDTYF